MNAREPDPDHAADPATGPTIDAAIDAAGDTAIGTSSAGTPAPPAPLAAPAARPVAYLVALTLAAIGVIAGHNLLARIEAIDRPEILAGLVDWLDGHGWDAVLLPASVAALILGTALALVAVKPSRRTHVRVPGDADMWLRAVDVGRIASRAARRCPGVYDATAIAAPRAVTVTIYGAAANGDDPADDVRAAVAAELSAAVAEPPVVKVRTLRGADERERRRRR